MCLVFGLLVSCDKNDNENTGDIIIIPEGYTLVWSDEFNDPVINLNKWNYQTGDGTSYGLPAGWGNNEKQIYTNSADNSSVIDDEGSSVLAITARKTVSGAIPLPG